MRVYLYDGVGDKNPVVKRATIVRIENEQGSPICIAVDQGSAGQVVSHAADEDFNTILRNLGFDKLVLCEDMPQPRELALR
jgi:hypothetical protein